MQNGTYPTWEEARAAVRKFQQNNWPTAHWDEIWVPGRMPIIRFKYIFTYADISFIE